MSKTAPVKFINPALAERPTAKASKLPPVEADIESGVSTRTSSPETTVSVPVTTPTGPRSRYEMRMLGQTYPLGNGGKRRRTRRVTRKKRKTMSRRKH